MPVKIDIHNINRKKLGGELHYGAQVEIRKRLAKKGTTVTDRTVRNAYDPKHPLSPTIAKIIKETVEYLNEIHRDYSVQLDKDLAKTLTGTDG